MSKGPGVNHSACHRGKKVSIKLRDGRIVVGKFIERKATFIVLENYGRIRKKDMASFKIAR